MDLWQEAQIIHSWMKPAAKTGKMLLVAATTIFESVMKGKGVIIRHQDRPAAFAYFMELGSILEIGGVVANPDLRHRGFASQAVEEVVLLGQRYSSAPLTAFSNEQSTGLFLNLGFRQKNKLEMPVEALELCAGCDEYPDWPNCHCRFVALDGLGLKQKDFWYSVFQSNEPKDLQAAARIFVSAFSEEPWCESWTQNQAEEILSEAKRREGSILLYATHRGEILGASAGFPINQAEFDQESSGTDLTVPEKPTFYIDELFVDAKWRGNGVGLSLSQQLLKLARERGFNRFLLRTDVEAYSARAIYKKLGFFDTGVRDAKYTKRSYWLL